MKYGPHIQDVFHNGISTLSAIDVFSRHGWCSDIFGETHGMKKNHFCGEDMLC
jgi:hypothetical protein